MNQARPAGHNRQLASLAWVSFAGEVGPLPSFRWLRVNSPQCHARSPVYVVRRNLGSPKISAISLCPPGEPPLLLLNENMPADRERFTCCHEVGHWVMHSEPALDTKQTGREADEFAAELLMPAAEIRHQLHDIDLAKAAALKALLENLHGRTHPP